MTERLHADQIRLRLWTREKSSRLQPEASCIIAFPYKEAKHDYMYTTQSKYITLDYISTESCI